MKEEIPFRKEDEESSLKKDEKEKDKDPIGE